MFKKATALLFIGIITFGSNGLSLAMMCGNAEDSHSRIAQADTATHEHGHTPAQETTPAVTKEAVNVGNKICPIGGEKIEEAMKATYEYESKVYNFCCAMCIDELKKDPAKAIKKIEEEKQKEK